MPSRCRICALEPSSLEAVNAALVAFQQRKIRLLDISQQTGLPAGSLFRHSQRHLPAAASNAPPAKAVVPSDTPAALALTKEELLSRLESVWREVISSVTESKELGHLHIRAGLLREARRTLELQGDWSGHFTRRIVGNEPGCLVTIVVPQTVRSAPEPKTVEIGLPRRLR